KLLSGEPTLGGDVVIEHVSALPIGVAALIVLQASFRQADQLDLDDSGDELAGAVGFFDRGLEELQLAVKRESFRGKAIAALGLFFQADRLRLASQRLLPGGNEPGLGRLGEGSGRRRQPQGSRRGKPGEASHGAGLRIADVSSFAGVRSCRRNPRRARAASSVRQRYSPRIPSESSWTPDRNARTTMVVVHPSTICL